MCDPPSRFRKIPFDKIGSHLSPAWGKRSESSEKYLESHLSIEKNIRGRVKKKETDLQCYTHYVKHRVEC